MHNIAVITSKTTRNQNDSSDAPNTVAEDIVTVVNAVAASKQLKKKKWEQQLNLVESILIYDFNIVLNTYFFWDRILWPLNWLCQ